MQNQSETNLGQTDEVWWFKLAKCWILSFLSEFQKFEPCSDLDICLSMSLINRCREVYLLINCIKFFWVNRFQPKINDLTSVTLTFHLSRSPWNRCVSQDLLDLHLIKCKTCPQTNIQTQAGPTKILANFVWIRQ